MELGHFYFCIASNVLDIFVRIQITCYNLFQLFVFLSPHFCCFNNYIFNRKCAKFKKRSKGINMQINNRLAMHINCLVCIEMFRVTRI